MQKHVPPGGFTSPRFARRFGARPSEPIGDHPRRVEHGEEEQGETLQFQDVKPARVGEVVEDGGDDGFVEEEAVVDPGEMIDQERRDKVKLRPGQGAPDRTERWTKAARDQQIDDAGHDSAVPEEEADRANVGEVDLEVGRENGLEGSADSPEVGDLRPARDGWSAERR